MVRILTGGGFALLLLLHNDFWNWNRPNLVLGLPVGLLYHLLYCVAVAGFMAIVLRLSRSPEPPS